MLGKVEVPDDDAKKKDKKLAKKAKRGKTKGGRIDVSPASSRTAVSPSTLHAPSIQGSSEEEAGEDENDENGERGGGDFSTYAKKKEESKGVLTGILDHLLPCVTY